MGTKEMTGQACKDHMAVDLRHVEAGSLVSKNTV